MAAIHRVRSLATAAAIGVLIAGCGGSGSAALSARSDPPMLHGTVPSGQLGRPEFTLLDAGHAYNFRARTQGRVTLLYAGYTHCPDECPTTMATIGVALRSLPRAVADRVTVVFVTVDPKRDNAQVLRTWLDRFHPPTPYVGLTGAPSQVARAEVALGIPIAKRRAVGKSYGSGEYAESHFDGLMAYGSNDRLQVIYPSDVTPVDLAADLKVLVEPDL